YRHAMDALIAARLSNRPAPEQAANVLRWAGRVVDAGPAQEAAREGAQMAAALTGAEFAAVATLVEADREQLTVFRAGTESAEAATWALRLHDWPAFRLAMDQAQPVELLPDGLGARQLNDLYKELGLAIEGSLLVAPLLAPQGAEGVMLLGGAPQGGAWPDDLVAIAPTLAGYIAQVIARARQARGTGDETAAVV